MTWTMSLVGLMFCILVWDLQDRGRGVEAGAWSCPQNWQLFNKVEPYECLRTFNPAMSYENAFASCLAVNAHLVTVMSEEKWSFVKNMILSSEWETMWMALRKDSSNYGPLTWRTRYGPKPISFTPSGYRSNSYSSAMCMLMNKRGHWHQRSCTSSHNMFICEKQVECQAGYFGGRCEKQCHCHGETCKSGTMDVKCRFGCLPGWMGEACDIRREKASIAFHCIHSGNSERRVSIEIVTKGIPYRHIQAIDDQDNGRPWCNDTQVHMARADKFVHVDIPVTDASLVEMKEGRCAGQETGKGMLQWRIALQEWQGIFMADDQVMLVKCDFNHAEALMRSTTIKVSGKKESSVSVSKESHEDVVLEVVDAATKRKLTSTFVGAPVLLKVQFGLSKDSLVQSLFPYDCEATTSDGSQRLKLLDFNGCQLEGSPVEPFGLTNDKNTLVTPWFPYFSFHGQDQLVVQCSFVFCYDTSCGVGCGIRTEWQTAGRFVTSSNGHND